MQAYSTNAPYSFAELEEAIRQVDRAANGANGVSEPLEARLFAPQTLVNPAALQHLWLSAQASAELLKLEHLTVKDFHSEPVRLTEGDGNRAGCDVFWWGYDLYIDSPSVNAIVGVLTGGAAVTGFLSFLASLFGPAGVPVALLAAIAAALMAFGAGLLTVMNATGRGVVVRGLWIGPAYIWPQ